jgi:hypothetical protein
MYHQNYYYNNIIVNRVDAHNYVSVDIVVRFLICAQCVQLKKDLVSETYCIVDC